MLGSDSRLWCAERTLPRRHAVQSHEVDYEIFGDDMQIVEVELDPGETVVAEAGAMNYMDEGIDFAAHMGDGSEAGQGLMGKLLGLGGLGLIWLRLRRKVS